MSFRFLTNKFAILTISFENYKYFVVLNYLLILTFRLLEFLLTAGFHHTQFVILLGIITDFFEFTIALFLLFPLYHMLFKHSRRQAQMVFIFFTVLFWTLHVCFLAYFVTEFKPVDIFVFQYQVSEILHTISSSGINWSLWLPLLLLPGIFILFSNNFLKSVRISSKYLIALILLTAPVYIFLKIKESNPLTENKSIYFYTSTIRHFMGHAESYSHSAEAYQTVFPGPEYVSHEYPFLHKIPAENRLGTYFAHSDTAPNIVILIIEGLGNQFVNSSNGICFMPFLDSLKQKGLYWDHFLTNGERSFSALPCITGSLPYGSKGFTFLEKLPRHLNLIHILKSNRYHTGFYYSQGAWMHNKDWFLKMSGIDLILDKNNFSPDAKKIITGPDNYFWGYNDRQLFLQYNQVADTLNRQPRLEIFFTGSMHPPFEIENESSFGDKFTENIRRLKTNDSLKHFNTYRKYYEAVMFTDDAIRTFFRNYCLRHDYKNTIFIITGDHPMSQIPAENPLKKYHVPLIIYSPLLSKPYVFHCPASHSDIFEPLLKLLQNNYSLRAPAFSSAIGNNLTDENGLCMNQPIVMMNDNREIKELYYNYYFLTGNEAYKVHSGFKLTLLNDAQVKKDLHRKLNLFKDMNFLSSFNNKLIPDSVYYNFLRKKILFQEHIPVLRSSGKEFMDVIQKIPVPAGEITVEFDFEYTTELKELPALVYQLRNSSDSIVFWKSLQLSEKRVYQTSIILDSKNPKQDSLSFQLYFWNTKKGKIKIKDLRLCILEQY